VPQPRVRLGLLVEPGVGRAGQLQQLGEHPPLGGLVLRHVVVELLAQGERLGQLGLGLVQRLLETGQRLLAVLRAGVGEVQLGGLDRLVQGEQLLAGAEGQLLGAGAVVRVAGGRLGGGALLRGPGRRRGLLPLLPAAHQRVAAPADQRDPGQHAQRPTAAVTTAGAAAVLQLLGHRDGRRRPVLLAQVRRDLGVDQVAQLRLVRHRGALAGPVADLPVLGGDGQQHVAVPETAQVEGLVGPLPRLHTGEVVDEDDEQLGAVLGLQVLQRRLDLLLRRAVQHVGLVGELLGRCERGDGERRARAQEHGGGTGGQDQERPGEETHGPIVSDPAVPRAGGAAGGGVAAQPGSSDITENDACHGSATTANRPNSVSCAASSTVPPPASTARTASSQAATEKQVDQPAGRPGVIPPRPPSGCSPVLNVQ
jgi:hypothetical protein